MKKVIYEAMNIDCPVCAAGLGDSIKKNVTGVVKIRVDFFTQKVHLIVEDDVNEDELFEKCVKVAKSFNRTFKLKKRDELCASIN